MIGAIDAVDYDGTPKEPTLTVTDGEQPDDPGEVPDELVVDLILSVCQIILSVQAEPAGDFLAEIELQEAVA